MERTKKVEEPEEVVQQVIDNDAPIRWRKNGSGSLRLSNPKRIVKPGEVFTARPSEISKAFRNIVVPLEALPDEALERVTTKKSTQPVYALQPRGNSKTWYDVVDRNGKVLNDKALNKEVAEKLIRDLER